MNDHALTRIAMALNELAAGILELSSGDAGAPPPATAAPQNAGAGASSPAPAAAFAAAQRQADPGNCPIHGTPFTWKAPGVSKAGKPYQGFFKCDGRMDDGGYCKEKPA